MDVRTGNIEAIPDEIAEALKSADKRVNEAAMKRMLAGGKVPISKEKLEQLKRMNHKQRKAWAKRERKRLRRLELAEEESWLGLRHQKSIGAVPVR